jgi:hypothetical protein
MAADSAAELDELVLSALGRQSRPHRAPVSTGHRARHLRGPQFRWRGPFSDDRHRLRPRAGVLRHVPGDKCPAVFGRPNWPPRGGLPVPRYRPARHGRGGQVDLRCALSVGPNDLPRAGGPSGLHLNAALARSHCVQLRRSTGGRSAGVGTARALSDRAVGCTRRSRRPHVVSAQRAPRLGVASGGADRLLQRRSAGVGRAR